MTETYDIYNGVSVTVHDGASSELKSVVLQECDLVNQRRSRIAHHNDARLALTREDILWLIEKDVRFDRKKAIASLSVEDRRWLREQTRHVREGKSKGV